MALSSYFFLFIIFEEIETSQKISYSILLCFLKFVERRYCVMSLFCLIRRVSQSSSPSDSTLIWFSAIFQQLHHKPITISIKWSFSSSSPLLTKCISCNGACERVEGCADQTCHATFYKKPLQNISLFLQLSSWKDLFYLRSILPFPHLML